ncbi:MAG: phosphoribosylformylglycinamidine synthase subunit PurL [Candidatus Coatesbacteria bacterium]|nr:phosphoribosylformylglycinamidine synthase subunit PurL [Candidatus Coatesbacteria bacterium]
MEEAKSILLKLKKETNCSLSIEELEILSNKLGRAPSKLEIYVFDTVWSEHCSYKSSRIFLKIFSNHKNPDVWVGIGEDAGIIKLGVVNNKEWGLVVGHESHNHPSQVVPYEGAATGIGGIVRDVYCMGADVIGVLDSLRFGDISEQSLEIINGVVDGIAGYANPLGIANLGGDTFLHPDYNDNCLVNVVALGIVEKDRIIHSYVPKESTVEPYVLILVGKATDSSGFGGASFASVVLDNEEAQKGAVQVPDPFLKRILTIANRACFDLIFIEKINAGFKDLGAGGILGASSEICGKGGKGADIYLDNIELAEKNLPPEVILTAETQERYIWAVPERHAQKLLNIYNKDYELGRMYEGACARTIGKVRNDDKYIVIHEGKEVLNLPVSILTEGITLNRQVTSRREKVCKPKRKQLDIAKALEMILNSPNIESKRVLFEGYDQEVGGRAVLRPGEADAGVIRPFPDSRIGIAVAIDGNPFYGIENPYLAGALAALESIHNVAATGALPIAITDCLNFGNPEDPVVLYDFSESIRGIKDTCEEIGYKFNKHVPLPVISGNVSFYNQSKQGNSIPPSPIVACYGILDDFNNAVSMGFKNPESSIILIGERYEELGGSIFRELYYGCSWGEIPIPRWRQERKILCNLHKFIKKKQILSAHDISKGGLLLAALEMAFTGKLGLEIDTSKIKSEMGLDVILFSESSGFLLEVDKRNTSSIINSFEELDIFAGVIGKVIDEERLLLYNNEQVLLDTKLKQKRINWEKGWKKYIC